MISLNLNETIADLLPLFIYKDAEIFTKTIGKRCRTYDERSFSKLTNILHYEDSTPRKNRFNPHQFPSPLRAKLRLKVLSCSGELDDQIKCFDAIYDQFYEGIK